MQYRELLQEMNLSEEILPEDEFNRLLRYAERKAELNHKPKSYVELLLPDVVREHLFSRITIQIFNLDRFADKEGITYDESEQKHTGTAERTGAAAGI